MTRGESGSDQAERIHSESSWETEGPGYGEGKRGKKKLQETKQTNRQTKMATSLTRLEERGEEATLSDPLSSQTWGPEASQEPGRRAVS